MDMGWYMNLDIEVISRFSIPLQALLLEPKNTTNDAEIFRE